MSAVNLTGPNPIHESQTEAKAESLPESPADRIWAYLQSGKGRGNDGLDDYNGNYRAFVPLGDVETADMRHHRERLKEEPVSDADLPSYPDDRSDSIAAAYRTTSSMEILTPPGSVEIKSGTIRFDDPAYEKSLQVMKGKLLSAARNPHPSMVIFHPPEEDSDRVSPLPNRAIVNIPFEPMRALGMENLVAALSCGRAGVMVVAGSILDKRGNKGGNKGIDKETLDLLQEQIGWARQFVTGLGYPKEAITLHEDGAESLPLPLLLTDLAEASRALPPDMSQFSRFQFDSSQFEGFPFDGSKRELLCWALKRLAENRNMEEKIIQLQEGAPYGQVLPDGDACTLCMACVSLCPTGALSWAGEAFPGLLFKEAECIQCGQCASVCPEKALNLHPRIAFGAYLKPEFRSLKADVPLSCIRCGSPFATRKMIETLTERLAGHWMFATDREKQRLRMCRECRIRDIYEKRKEKDSE